ncbi:MAG: two-component regulator propeller domain-containing protein [Bacteroidota bacterium]
MNILRIAILFPVILLAQHTPLKRITINDGLSQNYIFSIHQDKKGFIWFGTKDGLNRYDGYSFTIFRKDNSDTSSLSDNTVTAIHQGDGDQLWIGTAGGGLQKFDPRHVTFTHYHHDPLNENSISHNHCTVIRTTKGGSVLVGTSGGGLNIFDSHNGRWKHFRADSNSVNSLQSDNVADVTEDLNGNIWVAAEGISIIDRNDIVTRLDRSKSSDENVLNKISSLFCDSLGRIWVSHRTGVDLYTGRTVQRVITATPQNNFYWFGQFRYDSHGQLWTTTAHHLIRIDPTSLRVEQIAEFADERVSNGFAVDHSDNIWVGTAGWGILMYTPRTDKFGRREGNFLPEVFSDLFPLLQSYSAKHKEVSSFDPIMRGNEFKIPFRTKSGEMFVPTTDADVLRIGTDGSIQRYPLVPGKTVDRKYHAPQFIIQDSSHTSWIIRNSGLVKFTGEKELYAYEQLYPDSIAERNTSGYTDITTVYVTQDGVMWFGTPTNGLLEYHPGTREKRWYRHREYDTAAISHNHILSIIEDPSEPKRFLWIGTDGGGLNRFDRSTKTFMAITEKQGFPNNTVYGILIDDEKQLWLSTNKGLVKFNPVDHSMRTFDVHDGLQSNEFNRKEFYKSSDGKMYFGGVNGYNAFFPKDITLNRSTPNVIFTDFRLFNKSVSFKKDSSILQLPIEFTEKIVLEHIDNVITFEFAALEYTAPVKNRFKYILEGFDKGWINNGISRTATYTNIDPGEYVFKVKASNSDGVWNEQESSITLVILPPFWMTWWFMTIVIVLFLSVGPILYYLRVTELKKEQRRQQEISHLLIESQESERKRIAQEMHDSLGQELLVIKNRAIMGLKTVGDETKEKRQLEQISEGATNILKLVRSLSHNLRPPELDRLGLTETIRSMLGNIRDASGKTLHAEVDEIDGLVKKEDEINLIRILQEALSNIEKHSDASEISITLRVDQQMILLRIKDNGRGYSSENVRHGIGLAGMSERVRILQGSLSIESTAGAGTTITITIPIQQRA